jgi:LDH2 family malate/lactate/ureidoglycolate dehydrogenase
VACRRIASSSTAPGGSTNSRDCAGHSPARGHNRRHNARASPWLSVAAGPIGFTDAENFRRDISKTRRELNAITPAPGFDRVLAPGQDKEAITAKYQGEGIDLADSVYAYLVSDEVNRDTYEEDASDGGR